MQSLIMAVAGPSAAGLVLGSVILWDRCREPHRDPRRTTVVVDQHTYRDACKRVDRLIDLGEPHRAWMASVAICLWLRSEVRYGRPRRRLGRAVDLERWELRRDTLATEAGLG